MRALLLRLVRGLIEMLERWVAESLWSEARERCRSAGHDRGARDICPACAETAMRETLFAQRE